jgi:integrase
MDIAPHDLRRTFAGLLEDQGVPIEKISAALRHSDIGTTQRYLADNPRRTIEALDGVVIEL